MARPMRTRSFVSPGAGARGPLARAKASRRSGKLRIHARVSKEGGSCLPHHVSRERNVVPPPPAWNMVVERPMIIRRDYSASGVSEEVRVGRDAQSLLFLLRRALRLGGSDAKSRERRGGFAARGLEAGDG